MLDGVITGPFAEPSGIFGETEREISMDTVEFQCGHCSQLLAVNREHLGQQVRCPHCQQTVLAPHPEPVPAPVPEQPQAFPATMEMVAPSLPPDEPESIFSAHTESDDLFGQVPEVELPPAVAMPPAALPALQTVQPPPSEMPNLELTAPEAIPTQTYIPNPAPPFTATEGAAALPVLDHASSAAAEIPQTAWNPTEPAAGAPLDELTTVVGTGPVRTSKGGGWIIPLFILPLFFYSILASALAWVYYKRLRDIEARPHPLEYLPDIEGDHPTRQRKGSRLEIPRPDPNLPLPERLRVDLHSDTPLRVGDLEVTPLRIERAPLSIGDYPEGRTEILRDQDTNEPLPALKLYLKLKNVSNDLPFYPLDRFFTRYYDPGSKRTKQRWSSADPPYTQLIVGKQHFYGGPTGWANRRLLEKYLNEYVKGQECDRALKPGEELETFVCTDPENKRLRKALEHYHGNLEWRVQLRRGVVDVKGRRVPAGVVVGVEFSDKDITDSNRGDG
jgi:DNA-directed RNA polymerase subunit RPC12/RpoP